MEEEGEEEREGARWEEKGLHCKGSHPWCVGCPVILEALSLKLIVSLSAMF